MNYTEARAWIDQIAAKGSVFGLETMENLLALLGNPQDALKFVHIAGTNGKGSVLAYLSTILAEAGYKVGRYVSPTLFSYRERIQVNGEYIDRDSFARLMSRVAEAVDEMKREGKPLPTAFEMETAVSFLYFVEQRCDIVTLEAGLGGRLDATNVVKTTVLAVLASISRDHMAVLGDTLAEIAWNKAGIFKPGVPAVSACQEAEAAEVIKKTAREQGCELAFAEPAEIRDAVYGIGLQKFSYREFEEIEIPLTGKHQIENAALAIEAVRMLRKHGWTISDEAVREGFAHTIWRGRFSVIHREPYIVMDGAHNPDAAKRLRESVKEYFQEKKIFFIFGVFSDKEYDKIIEITAPLAEHIVTIETPNNPRALPADKLAEAVRRVNPSVEAADGIEDAVRICRGLAGKEDVILIFGSLSFLAEAERTVAAVYGETGK